MSDKKILEAVDHRECGDWVVADFDSPGDLAIALDAVSETHKVVSVTTTFWARDDKQCLLTRVIWRAKTVTMWQLPGGMHVVKEEEKP